MHKLPTSLRILAGFMKHNVALTTGGIKSIGNAHVPKGPAHVPECFFGVAAATSPDPSCDDYVVDRLRELGVMSVRLDYREEPHIDRLAERLLKESFRLCVHIVQTFEDANHMQDENHQNSWRELVTRVAYRYGDRVEMIEIGSTINRRSWSGYNMRGFLTAWVIAHDVLTARNIPIAGPNVTDFEPMYNAGILGVMSDMKCLPNIHTENLFVERVTEPERFDHRVLGKAMTGILKLNTVKKARLINAISGRFGVAKTACTHVSWSLRRIDRILPDKESKQADYTARYACLVAASGAFNNLYWGPMIGQRAGLIDDGTQDYPEIPHVTWYGITNGTTSDYRVRPSFHAYRTAARNLSGATFKRTLRCSQGLEIYEFSRQSDILHVAWTTNGNVALAADCYQQIDLKSASAVDRDGKTLDRVPSRIFERPVYLTWRNKESVDLMERSAHIIENFRVSPKNNTELVRTTDDQWYGYQECTEEQSAEIPAPDKLSQNGDKTILRDRRNTVWSMPDPRSPEKKIVVKRSGPGKWYRRILQYRRPSRARRSWNSAHELLRRGIRTSRPAAFFENVTAPTTEDSYYVYEMFEADHSIRDAFTTFSHGSTSFKGVDDKVYYELVAAFLHNMHERGVYYRDLSAGNILAALDTDGKPFFSLIDTARARFYEHAVCMRKRILDLRRIVHPLRWEQRHIFLGIYFARCGKSLTWPSKIPFFLYDAKHAVKARIRKKK